MRIVQFNWAVNHFFSNKKCLLYSLLNLVRDNFNLADRIIPRFLENVCTIFTNSQYNLRILLYCRLRWRCCFFPVSLKFVPFLWVCRVGSTLRWSTLQWNHYRASLITLVRLSNVFCCLYVCLWCKLIKIKRFLS